MIPSYVDMFGLLLSSLFITLNPTPLPYCATLPLVFVRYAPIYRRISNIPLHTARVSPYHCTVSYLLYSLLLSPFTLLRPKRGVLGRWGLRERVMESAYLRVAKHDL
jgi:hypothetical protein